MKLCQIILLIHVGSTLLSTTWASTTPTTTEGNTTHLLTSITTNDITTTKETATTALTTTDAATTTNETTVTHSTAPTTNPPATTTATNAPTTTAPALTNATTPALVTTTATTAPTTAPTTVITQTTSNATAMTTSADINTTTVHTTATTHAPTNATTQPATTTALPTTTAEPPATTTANVLTTTQQPNLKQNFTCHDNGTTKFNLTGKFALSVTYTKNSTKEEKTINIDVPKTDQFEAICNTSESLKFEFFKGWSIEYIFEQEPTKSSSLLTATSNYYISNITVIYVHDEHLPDSTAAGATSEAKFNQTGYLEASPGAYYSCRSTTTQKLSNEVSLITSDFKYRAFNDNGDINLDFGSVTECSADEETSSVVPIAVGAALAGLVVIVLIAYLIGRKRSRKEGYENV